MGLYPIRAVKKNQFAAWLGNFKDIFLFFFAKQTDQHSQEDTWSPVNVARTMDGCNRAKQAHTESEEAIAKLEIEFVIASHIAMGIGSVPGLERKS